MFQSPDCPYGCQNIDHCALRNAHTANNALQIPYAFPNKAIDNLYANCPLKEKGNPVANDYTSTTETPQQPDANQ